LHDLYAFMRVPPETRAMLRTVQGRRLVDVDVG